MAAASTLARRLYDGRVQDDALRRRVALDGRHDALVVAANIRDAAPPQTQRNNRVQVHGLAVVDLPRRAGVVAAGAPRVLQAPHGLLHLEGLGLGAARRSRLRRLADELLLVADFALALFGHLFWQCSARRAGVCHVCYHTSRVGCASPTLQRCFGAAEIALMPTRLQPFKSLSRVLVCQNEPICKFQTEPQLVAGLLVSYMPLAAGGKLALTRIVVVLG